MKNFTLYLSLVLALALGAGCSDDDMPGTKDGKAGGDSKGWDLNSGLPDGYVLYDCTDVGKACNAHDPCAINPVCGPDKKCRPSSVMSCDDKLACTVDTCAGQGLCKNTPKKGFCKLAVKVPAGTTCATMKLDGGSAASADAGVDAGAGTTTIFCCFNKGDRKPGDVCLTCNPTETDAGATNNTKWSGATGGSCDDGNACTKNDYCNSGTCKGTYYGSQCSDGYGCTDDLCDGKGGCLSNKLKKDWCLINATCYKDGANHPGGSCYTCDVTKSQSSWTAITNTCMIGGKCYKPKDKDSTGCGECDPTKSTTAWTPLPNMCLINGKCYKSGATDPTGCGHCDPKKSTTSWTPIGTTKCLIDGKCYSSGAKNAKASCGVCDPKKSTTAWSLEAGKCYIGGTCYATGTKHAAGCAVCDPATNPVAWTVKVTTHCLINGACKKSGDKQAGGCGVCTPSKDRYAWTQQTGTCTKCKAFSGTIGKKCTSATSLTDCGSTALCLLTGTTGVCTQKCTADNPATTTNEDTCPGQPANVCAGVPLSDGTTMYLCMHRCRPALGCNECASTVTCHPQSGAMVGLRGQGVCLYPKSTGCEKDADCYVTTGVKCDTGKKNCATGQPCLAYSSDATFSTDGICAKTGTCDKVSGICKAHKQGKTGVTVGAPCAGDVDCANGQKCNLEYDDAKYRKKGGSSCTYNSECCSGTCTKKVCTSGTCRLRWRNGHCGISNCLFANTLTQAACPAGSVCNKIFSTGLCQKTCDMTKASTCRGKSADKLGDYECRDWSRVVARGVGLVSSKPTCDMGPFMPCSSAGIGSTIPTCAFLGNTGNSTKMSCRSTTGTALTNIYHPGGYCLDNTSSGSAPAKPDSGPAPTDGGMD